MRGRRLSFWLSNEAVGENERVQSLGMKDQVREWIGLAWLPRRGQMCTHDVTEVSLRMVIERANCPLSRSLCSSAEFRSNQTGMKMKEENLQHNSCLTRDKKRNKIKQPFRHWRESATQTKQQGAAGFKFHRKKEEKIVKAFYRYCR